MERLAYCGKDVTPNGLPPRGEGCIFGTATNAEMDAEYA